MYQLTGCQTESVDGKKNWMLRKLCWVRSPEFELDLRRQLNWLSSKFWISLSTIDWGSSHRIPSFARQLHRQIGIRKRAISNDYRLATGNLLEFWFAISVAFQCVSGSSEFIEIKKLSGSELFRLYTQNGFHFGAKQCTAEAERKLTKRDSKILLKNVRILNEHSGMSGSASSLLRMSGHFTSVSVERLPPNV